MKRKTIGLLLSCMLVVGVLVMGGCGSSSESSSESSTAEEVETEAEEEEEEEPLSLIGNWEPAELDDSYQAGYISEERIEIFWVSDGGDTVALYWSGTYDAPTEATDSYSWDSINDTSITDYALLAATAETKTFTYENGVLTYEVTALGTTTTYDLVMTDTDYTIYASDVSDESESTDSEISSDVEVLILSDDNVDVYYTGCSESGLKFTITNYTDSEIYLAFSTLALDGISYDIMNSDSYNSIIVAPNSTGSGVQEMPDEFDTEFSILSGTLGYDVGDEIGVDSYSFSDISVE